MWPTQREERRRIIVSYIEIFQIIFLITVFAVGLIGFMKAATNDDDKKED